MSIPSIFVPYDGFSRSNGVKQHHTSCKYFRWCFFCIPRPRFFFNRVSLPVYSIMFLFRGEVWSSSSQEPLQEEKQWLVHLYRGHVSSCEDSTHTYPREHTRIQGTRQPALRHSVRRTDLLSLRDDLDPCGEDLYGLAHVSGWELYDLHGLTRVSRVGCVLSRCRSRTAYHNGSHRIDCRWSRSWSR